jgi:(1->4)-alpha-D-glucan 1-alpha-D-glucosylmutase
VAPYLHRLGISHLYSSPYLQAAPGSTHGYDVVDPRRVNDELGGPVAHQRFSKMLGESDLGQILDVVPNHMAIGGSENPWWWDVLENGPSSKYARFFDVEWHSPDPEFRATVLLPVLGDHYGRVLEAGELQVVRDKAHFHVAYADRRFPVAPPALEPLLVEAGKNAKSEELVFIGESLGRLPSSWLTDRESATRRHRGKEVLTVQRGRLLADRPELAEAVDAALARLNGDTDRLDEFLAKQNYRLAFWRAARDDLDYRRFFDVTSLAGLRMEDDVVFGETHELIATWLREGVLDGLRVDHPDGLRDPKRYFERLRREAPDAWIVAEKILESDEKLRTDWPVNGTTGYDFLNHVTRLFVDPRAEEPLTTLYEEFTGIGESFEEIAYADRQRVVRDVLASEFNRLIEYFVAVVRGNRRNRDFARAQLRDALREVVCNFPVYRTYVRAEDGEIAGDDRRYVAMALERAAQRRPEVAADLLEFIGDVLLLRVTGAREAEFVMRFQQFTAPVMAKGVEDTAFYAYNRLVALNEVGGDPGTFGESVAEFHAACAVTQRDWPTAMLASSTHDTKRAEDVRIRIGLLSEIPERWAETVWRWRTMNEGKRSGEWPDANTEYLIYQTLVGAWPLTEDRLAAYLQKAMREAKRFTSWTDSNTEYEAAVQSFAAASLSDRAFVAEVDALVADLTPAWHATSLAQTLLKVTCPGVPDIYQGTELWDLSLVDPDNRRPVDFEARRDLLERASTATAAEVMADADSGLPKIWLISRVLELRARRAEAFGPRSSYEPLPVSGSAADRVVAFVRGGETVTIVPRFVLAGGDWGVTRIALPDGEWQDVFSGETVNGGEVDVAPLLADFPVALLERALA